MFKKNKQQDLGFIIDLPQNLIDIVLKYPISVLGKNISEFRFELSYFFNWVHKEGLNLRIDVSYDSISESRRHTAKTVRFDEYVQLPQEQIKNHISKFINEYQKTQNYGSNQN